MSRDAFSIQLTKRIRQLKSMAHNNKSLFSASQQTAQWQELAQALDNYKVFKGWKNPLQKRKDPS